MHCTCKVISQGALGRLWRCLQLWFMLVSTIIIYRRSALAQSTVGAKYAFKNNSITILMSLPSYPANIQHSGLRRVPTAYTATRGYQRWSLWYQIHLGMELLYHTYACWAQQHLIWIRVAMFLIECVATHIICQ